MKLRIELDDDILEGLRAEMLRTGESINQVANRILFAELTNTKKRPTP